MIKSRGDALYFSFILPFCALLQESRKVPRKVRFLMGIFLFYSIVVGVFYNSNLISFLSFPEHEKVPHTWEDLAQRKDYDIKLAYYVGGAGIKFFAETNIATFIGLLFFGWIWGLWGILLAIPLLAIVKTVCDANEDWKPVAELLGR